MSSGCVVSQTNVHLCILSPAWRPIEAPELSRSELQAIVVVSWQTESLSWRQSLHLTLRPAQWREILLDCSVFSDSLSSLICGEPLVSGWLVAINIWLAWGVAFTFSCHSRRWPRLAASRRVTDREREREVDLWMAMYLRKLHENDPCLSDGSSVCLHWCDTNTNWRSQVEIAKWWGKCRWSLATWTDGRTAAFDSLPVPGEARQCVSSGITKPAACLKSKQPACLSPFDYKMMTIGQLKTATGPIGLNSPQLAGWLAGEPQQVSSKSWHNSRHNCEWAANTAQTGWANLLPSDVSRNKQFPSSLQGCYVLLKMKCRWLFSLACLLLKANCETKTTLNFDNPHCVSGPKECYSHKTTTHVSLILPLSCCFLFSQNLAERRLFYVCVCCQCSNRTLTHL